MMNNKTLFSKKSREGGIAIALLLIAFSVMAVVGSYIRFSMQNTFLTRKVIDQERARIFAESALDSAEVQVRLAIENRAQGLSGGMSLQDQLDALVAPVFTDPAGSYVADVFSSKTLNGMGGFVETNMNGIIKEYIDVVITSGVINTNSGATASFQEVVRIIREPFLRYAIFYDKLLELHPGPTMVVSGDLRSNADIEFWAGSELLLNGTVRAPGMLEIFKSDAPDSYSTESRRARASRRVKVLVDGAYKSFWQDNAVLDSRSDEWDSKSKSTWNGQVFVGDKVSTLNLPIEKNVDNHALIDPPDPLDSDKVHQTKLSNKADLYIRVSSHRHVYVSTTGANGPFSRVHSGDYANLGHHKDGNGVYQITNDGWINLNYSYYDPRESEEAYQGGWMRQRMEMVDIYMDKLIEEYPNHEIVYVEVETPSYHPELKPAVRLRNGNDLSGGNQTAGLTIASHRTMYVEGNYNAEHSIPALIAADNLTILSNGWDDGNSRSWNPGGALETDLHAAVMIGYADPDNPDGEKTGGAHNLVRYREKWTGKYYNFTGSYISLWTAIDSHCVYSGRYYSPPRRNITYDPVLKTTQPPGMPIGYSTPEVLFWKEITRQEALNAI